MSHVTSAMEVDLSCNYLTVYTVEQSGPKNQTTGSTPRRQRAHFATAPTKSTSQCRMEN